MLLIKYSTNYIRGSVSRVYSNYHCYNIVWNGKNSSWIKWRAHYGVWIVVMIDLIKKKELPIFFVSSFLEQIATSSLNFLRKIESQLEMEKTYQRLQKLPKQHMHIWLWCKTSIVRQPKVSRHKIQHLKVDSYKGDDPQMENSNKNNFLSISKGLPIGLQCIK